MLYVTGDTHGQIDFYKLVKFAKENPKLTKADYVIVAGDFGGVWYKQTLEKDLNYYSRLPFTVLFVDGNHENFVLLNSFPIEIWNGGKVHKLRDDIIHLTRGQVFTIEGKKIFTFGGATSIDRMYRVEGESWWRQELPHHEELEEGIANLKKHGDKVDFIITHSCDAKAIDLPPLCKHLTKRCVFPENEMLSIVENSVDYRHWYFGHYHMDGDLTERKTVLYQEIRELK
ncbi:MAG: metallophosphoesterase [Clostridia bacterium]|nr:metallophosphoesterase [Clostridia bacterium]